jgi:hypothetical protein
MKKLYIPTSTLNFNNILSTESISPLFFYSKRKFGYKRFESVESNSLEKSILIYDKVPLFHLENKDIDNYPLIIEISDDLLDDDYIDITNCEKNIAIIKYNKTIYLHPNKVKFIFISEENKKICLIKSEPSIETKLLPIYISSLKILGSENTFKWNKNIINDINDINDMFNHINNDLITDKLKGFYFSYYIGLIESEKLETNDSLKIDGIKKSIEKDISSIISKFKILTDMHGIDTVDILKIYKESAIVLEEKILNNSNIKLENKDPVINFSNLKITHLDDKIYKIKGAEIYKSIINDILVYPIYDEASFLENRVDLTLMIGRVFKEYIPNWESSPVREYLNSLMDNIESYKKFDLDIHLKNDSSKYLLQSVAIFIMNGNNPENLLNKLSIYNLDPRVSFGFFGAVFGFSAIPKTITNILFNKNNIARSKKIYKNSQYEIHNLSTDFDISIEKINNNITYAKNSINEKQNYSNSILNNNSLKCFKCGKEMVIKTNQKNSEQFYGCEGYPKCRNTKKIKKDKKISELVCDYVSKNGESKNSEIIKYIKIKYSVKELTDLIDKDNRLIGIKIGRANGARLKDT